MILCPIFKKIALIGIYPVLIDFVFHIIVEQHRLEGTSKDPVVHPF